MAVTQTLWLNPDDAQRVRQAVERLHAERYVPRVWARDASLWSGDPAVQAEILQRLGWLTIAETMRQRLAPVHQAVEDIRRAGFTHALLLGMGGSSLFAEVGRHLYGVRQGRLDLAILDSTDPAAIRSAQQRCPLERLLIIVSSKSGSTAEVSALSSYFHAALQTAGRSPGQQCIAITDSGTPLETQAHQLTFRHVFTHGPQTGADVGGRFSALTYFGLVPAALTGIAIERWLDGAQAMLQRCSSGVSADQNPAVQLGAALGALAPLGRDQLTFLASAPLAPFGAWVEQLVAESTGKTGQGITPLLDESRSAIQADATRRVIVELQLRGELDQTLARDVDALAAAGHPVIRMHWDTRDDVGGAVMHWAMATTIAGSLLGVNPFDEPNVQESKDRTKALLQSYLQTHALTMPHVSTSAEAVERFLRGRKPHEYLALLSFLPRTPVIDEAVKKLREALAARFRCPTLLQVGPRYLHSTGQLFKGGRDGGIFLLLTADETEDLLIPSQPYSFKILKQAQALGDVQAMQDHGRRILHIHLRQPLDSSIRQLLHTIGRV